MHIYRVCLLIRNFYGPYTVLRLFDHVKFESGILIQILVVGCEHRVFKTVTNETARLAMYIKQCVQPVNALK